MKSNSILIIDDEAIVRESLRDLLIDSYDIELAESGEEALELIKKKNFNVLIIDVRLPGKNGLQILKEVKEIKPHIKAIIITAFPSPENAAIAKQLGAIDYLIKPLSPDQLELLIKRTLEKAHKAGV